MARPLTGSVRQLANGRWEASVPKTKGARQRVTATFGTEAEARTWIREQIERLNLALCAVTPMAAAPHQELGSFEYFFLLWHALRTRQHPAKPGRLKAIADDARIHLFPLFGPGPLDTDAVAVRARLQDWVRAMAGYTSTETFVLNRDQTYAREVVNHLLWIINEVYVYAALNGGVDIPRHPVGKTIVSEVMHGVEAMEPKGRTRRKAKLVDLRLAREIASHLHVVHQVAFWIMRIAGLRAGERCGEPRWSNHDHHRRPSSRFASRAPRPVGRELGLRVPARAGRPGPDRPGRGRPRSPRIREVLRADAPRSARCGPSSARLRAAERASLPRVRSGDRRMGHRRCLGRQPAPQLHRL